MVVFRVTCRQYRDVGRGPWPRFTSLSFSLASHLNHTASLLAQREAAVNDLNGIEQQSTEPSFLQNRLGGTH